MKNSLFAAACLLPILAQGYDEEVLFENEQVYISKWKILPGEAVGRHCDDHPQVVIALKGGTITRIGEDGSTTDSFLPTGKAIFQEADPELHDAINASNQEIEAIMIEIIGK